MACTHDRVGVDDITHSKLCIDCGIVLGESDIFEASFFEAPNRLPVSNERYWQQHQLISSICDRFALKFTNQACHKFNELALLNRGLVDRGTKGRLAAAISILIVNKQISDKAAISIADLSSAINESPIALGRYIALLKKNAPEVAKDLSNPDDSQIFFERYLQEGVRPVFVNVEFDIKRILMLAKDVHTIAQMAWLHIGRKPESFYMACLFVALDCAVSEKKMTKQMKLKILERFSLPFRTVYDRQHEIIDILIQESSRIFPWKITKSTLPSHLEEVVKVLLTVEAFADNSEPPAFEAALYRRSIMERRVDKAQERLNGGSGVPHDELDLLIEKLLLRKAPVDKIVECSNPGQLDKLLDEYLVNTYNL